MERGYFLYIKRDCVIAIDTSKFISQDMFQQQDKVLIETVHSASLVTVRLRREAPFVEQIPNKKIIIKLQKKKDQMIFSHIWFLFVIQGVRIKHFKYFLKSNKILYSTL